MQNKLQELTEKLYNEGLSKGKQDAEELKANAKAQAAEIVKKANEEAAQILKNAQLEAEELKKKSENDIKMASGQALQQVKHEIEQAIVCNAVGSKVGAAMKDADFVKSVILEIVKAFNPANSEPVALDVVLPESKKAELSAFMENQVKELCGKGLNVSFSNGVKSGFKIGPSEKGYKLSFTGEDFEAIISEYLRPKTKALVFGK